MPGWYITETVIYHLSKVTRRWSSPGIPRFAGSRGLRRPGQPGGGAGPAGMRTAGSRVPGLGDGPCPGEGRGYNAPVERVVHVPYTVEQDETGWWCAHAPLPGGGANGEGQTPEEAVADLRQALDGWFAEFGVPEELTVTVPDVA